MKSTLLLLLMLTLFISCEYDFKSISINETSKVKVEAVENNFTSNCYWMPRDSNNNRITKGNINTEKIQEIPRKDLRKLMLS